MSYALTPVASSMRCLMLSDHGSAPSTAFLSLVSFLKSTPILLATSLRCTR